MTDSKYTRQTVTAVYPWVPGKLFSLRLTRPDDFVFKAGQFARIGLPLSDAPNDPPTLWRAYSMVSGPADHELEFYSILVPTGLFSPRLATLKPGDALYLEKVPYGFFTIDRFAPKEPLAPIEHDTAPLTDACPPVTPSDLWLIASGTGLSTYLSILQDPATWTRFRRLILIHGVRYPNELVYQQAIKEGSLWPEVAHRDPHKFIYVGIPTRATLPGVPRARLTTLLADGRLEALVGETLDPTHSKVMLCGNPDMLKEAREYLATRNIVSGRRGIPGSLAVENYWS